MSSGNGTEKENLAIEKKYEEADLRGHRPCKLRVFFTLASLIFNLRPDMP